MNFDVTVTLRSGVAAHERGDTEAARAAYEKILEKVPGHADATHLLGVLHFQANDLPEAAALIEKAIGLDPHVALYHANLGRVYRKLNDPSAAVDAFRHAIQLTPDDAGLHVDLSSALIAAGEPDAARARANLALDLDANRADAYTCLGLALQDIHGADYGDAMTAFERAVALDPSAAGAHLGLGLGYHAAQPDKAKAAYIAAVNADPTLVEAWTNLGNLARDVFDFKAAVTCYRHALAHAPENGAVWGNLGVALQESGALSEAIDAYDKACAFAPDDSEVARNRAMGLLADGRYADGWPAYEARWGTARFQSLKREWPVPAWTGDALKGRHIYVHAEQGLGDTLQFCRYVSVLAARGARVTLECPDNLHRLMGTLSGVYAVVAPGDPLPSIDCHVPLLSIPALIGLDPNEDPAPSPYLTAPTAAVRRWQERIAALPQKKKIGIAWRGSPDHARDAIRSPGLAPFGVLAAPDVALISLQKDNAADDLARYGDGIIDWTAEITDFADTAGLMMHLDVVVSCDSAPLHLAGALSVPSVAVLPHVAEWRWGGEGDTTPWYPSMTLARQPAFGDWGGAIALVQGMADL